MLNGRNWSFLVCFCLSGYIGHHFFSPFLPNCRIDEHIASVCYSSPRGWPDTRISLHANSVAARLLPSLCWWLLPGLYRCVMLADAICCKLASWPESYPTSLAAGLCGTNGCGQLLSKLRWRSEATNVHPCINSGVGVASALSEGSYLRHCTTKGQCSLPGVCPHLRLAWCMKEMDVKGKQLQRKSCGKSRLRC